MGETLSPCPFCGAAPHHGLGKVEHDSLHGDPFQRAHVWCPTCKSARVSGANLDLAKVEWNRRIPDPAATMKEVRDRIGAKALVFESYAELHRAKGTADGLEKAIANQMHANELRALIAKLGGE